MAKKKPKKPAAPLYSWDGGPKTHTVPQAEHQQNVQAKGYGIDLNAPATSPLTNRGVYGLAQQAADLQYGPQIKAAQQMGQLNAPAWYQNYIDRATRAQAAATQYAAPVLQQAQQWANQPAQAAPGLDANSPYAAQSQQAAQSGSGLAKLGADVLGAVQNSTTGYLAGQQSAAARDLPQAQAFYGQQAAQLQGERGKAVAANYATGRQAEQNAEIAYGTLGLNTQKAADDAAADVQTAKDKKAARVVSRKNTRDRITAQDQRSQEAADKAAAKEQAAKDKEAAKKKAAIDKATGKTRTKITDIIEYQQHLVGQMGEDTSKPKDPVTLQYPRRKITQEDVDRAKRGKYGFLGRIAIAIREGRPLDQRAVDYLHELDPNLRIPREWLQGKRSGGSGVSGERNVGTSKQDTYGSGPGHH
jgi:hypothetical protein